MAWIYGALPLPSTYVNLSSAIRSWLNECNILLTLCINVYHTLNNTFSNQSVRIYNKCVCSSVSLFRKGNLGYVIMISVYLSFLTNFDFDKISVDITPCAMTRIYKYPATNFTIMANVNM